MRIIDSHCHLTDHRLSGQVEQVVERARAAGVVGMVTVGCGAADCAAAAEMARRFPDVWAAAGIHPHDATKADAENLRAIEDALSENKVVAVGEAGLDWHYDFAPRQTQVAAFEAQLQLARRLDRPIIVHCREAIPEALELIAGGEAVRGVFHCFTGTAAEAEAILRAGFFISLAGVVTFRNSEPLRAAARTVPLGRLLVETDSPYLSPEPVRKCKVNEPANVVHVARFLADLRGIDADELAERTAENTRALFGMM